MAIIVLAHESKLFSEAEEKLPVYEPLLLLLPLLDDEDDEDEQTDE